MAAVISFLAYELHFTAKIFAYLSMAVNIGLIMTKVTIQS